MTLPSWLAGAPQVRHIEHCPARTGVTAPLPAWVPDEVTDALAAQGITALWGHQAEVAEVAHAGRHVSVCTGTASGKTLGYLLPVAAATYGGPQACIGPRLATSEPRPRLMTGRRPHTALYLAPTKALAHDQLRVCRDLGLSQWRVGTLDGDSERDERRFAAEFATFVLTNPDMLHQSVLPRHARWRELLSSLRYVVVDECHRYRGVFGAHVAAVLRRLRRLCRQYGADPVFICASATVGDDGRAAATLIGEQAVCVIDRDDSPHGAVDHVLWQPDGAAEHDSAALMARLVDEGHRTLTFVSSRTMAEVVAVRAAEMTQTERRIAAYRSGYLAGDRRSLERDLQSGTLHGAAATNALELGVDIAGLDAVVLNGFPGTLAAFRQQVGRAGRRGEDALAVMVARENPIDAYLMDHPEMLFSAPVETPVLHADNPYVLGPHLAAAAQEAPLTAADSRWFGDGMAALADTMASQGLLRRRPTGWYWTRGERAVDAIDLRAMGGRPCEIVEWSTGRVIGTVDRAAAERTVFAGAVHLHQGEQWLVDEFDREQGTALVHREEPGYYTQAKSMARITVVRERERRSLGAGWVCWGDVALTEQVTGFLRRDEFTHAVWDETPLDSPQRTTRTQAMWWVFPSAATASTGLSAVRLGAAAHAAEHTALALLPMFAPCDRSDLGGLSTVLHHDTEECTVFIHDGRTGGAGYAHRAFDVAEELLAATLQRLASCPCATGCPACVVSSTCGEFNTSLDKGAASVLMATLAGAGARAVA